MARMFLQDLFPDVNEMVSLDSDMIVFDDVAALINESRQLQVPFTNTTRKNTIDSQYPLWSFPLLSPTQLCACTMVTDLSRFRRQSGDRDRQSNSSQEQNNLSNQHVDLMQLVQKASEKYERYNKIEGVFIRSHAEQTMLIDIYRLKPEYFLDVPSEWKHSWCNTGVWAAWEAVYSQTSLLHFNCMSGEPVWDTLWRRSHGLHRLAQCVMDHNITCTKTSKESCGKVIKSEVPKVSH